MFCSTCYFVFVILVLLVCIFHQHFYTNIASNEVLVIPEILKIMLRNGQYLYIKAISRPISNSK